MAARNDDYTETEPCFIAEVLSESTRMADQNSKAERHRELPSLQAYFLVRRGVSVWRRGGESWSFEVVGETFELSCPSVTPTLADLHVGINFRGVLLGPIQLG